MHDWCRLPRLLLNRLLVLRTGQGMSVRTIFRILISCCAVALIGLVLVGFSGRVFSPGDTLAVIRPLTGAALLILAAALVWLAAPRIAGVALAFGMVALASVAPGYVATGSDCTADCLTVYQKNLLSRAWPRYPLADDIIASGAHVVTLQEVSDHNRQFMARLFDHYPGRVTCAFRPEQDVAVLTSLPIVANSEFCLAGAGMAGLQVLDHNSQPTWVVSVHQEWPFPYDQFRQSALIANRIAELDGPVLIAGDFNMVPWGGSVQRIRRAANATHLGGYRNTYRMGSWILPLPIDMLLVPQGVEGAFERRPTMGSDHYGVLARISMPEPH